MNILVTGASSGIGYAASSSLAARGHNVIVVARTLRALKSLQRKYGDCVHMLAVDVSAASGRDEIAKYVGTLTSLDGLVHAAGSQVAPLSYPELDVEKIVDDMKVHVMAPITLNNLLAGVLSGARVLYIDSYSAINPRDGWAGYSIVKAAAQMAARSAANELGNCKVIRVFPGAVRTPLVEAVLNSRQRSATVELFNELNLAGQINSPEIIGDYIANILSSATDAQLDSREIWDFSNPEDQIF